MMKYFQITALLILAAFYCAPAHAQRITEPVLKNVVKSTISTSEKKPVEKVYVQTDKVNYSFGDTIRMKCYLLSGDYRSPSEISGILYAELNDESGKSVKRIMLPVIEGLAWADMALDTADVKPGNYTLMAYTNWMRNFGEDYIFKKQITVSRYQGNPLLAKTFFKQTESTVEGEVLLSQLDGRLQAFKDVEVKLMSGKKNVSKDKLVTGADGRLKLNFVLPDNAEPLSIKAKTAGSAELSIPVMLSRPENTDVQFMPEGGALVAGIQSKVGIKAIGEDGKGINVTGKLLDSKGEEVAVINTIYKGMGSFSFVPQPGESYTAKLNGITKSYSLHSVNPSGTTISITTADTTSLQIKISATPDKQGTYYLIGQARGVVCYAEPVNIANGVIEKTLSKKLFPTGIARFTLLNTNQQPLNERIVFINHKDELRFNIQPHKNNYTTRDSIALLISVTDKAGKPIQGSFSMAVTDNSQVKIDSLGSNILSNLLLTSDLQGDIEAPGYYFTGNKDTELDNLMLTQGWVGYDWNDILSTEAKPISYQPEKEFVVSGKVTNAFGKPIEKSPIALMSKSPLIVADTLTDKDGKFRFREIWPVDTAIFKIQARNKNNKEFNVTIKMDEQTFPEFKPNRLMLTPWYVNTDTTLLNNAGSVVAEEKAMENYKGEGNVLKEVNIKAKKVVKGSKNLNGPGEADLVLDEQDMLKAGKRTLKDLLKEKVPGMQEFGTGKRPIPYTLYGKRVSFVFDGIDIDKFFHPDYASIDQNPMLREKDDMKHDLFVRERSAMIDGYLNYYTAEDVVGIELMFNPKYNRAYASNLVPGGGSASAGDRVGTPKFNSRAYIEITTRSKQGPFMKATPGTYLYKSLAFTFPKQFYSPKYTAKNKSTAVGTDMRSTIFWEPNIITDAEGKAAVSFYSADKVTGYSVIVEGTDMQGQLGHKKAEIVVSK
jgi:hypothetical protein